MRFKVIAKNIIQCKRCGDIIESKYTHDFVWCSCGCCAVDGGLSYLRRCGDMNNWVDLSEYKVIETKPKYEKGDKVTFTYMFNEIHTGVIQVVDAYPSIDVPFEYDILSEEENMLYKHVEEKMIIRKVKTI